MNQDFQIRHESKHYRPCNQYKHRFHYSHHRSLLGGWSVKYVRALKAFCGKCPKRFSYFSCEKWWRTITSAWLVVNTYTLTQIRVNFVFRACVGFWRLWFNLAGKLAHRVWLMLRPDMTLDHISWRKIRHQLFIMLKWQLLS